MAENVVVYDFGVLTDLTVLHGLGRRASKRQIRAIIDSVKRLLI